MPQGKRLDINHANEQLTTNQSLVSFQTNISRLAEEQFQSHAADNKHKRRLARPKLALAV